MDSDLTWSESVEYTGSANILRILLLVYSVNANTNVGACNVACFIYIILTVGTRFYLRYATIGYHYQETKISNTVLLEQV